jgi:hypothetical protein
MRVTLPHRRFTLAVPADPRGCWTSATSSRPSHGGCATPIIVQDHVQMIARLFSPHPIRRPVPPLTRHRIFFTAMVLRHPTNPPYLSQWRPLSQQTACTPLLLMPKMPPSVRLLSKQGSSTLSSSVPLPSNIGTALPSQLVSLPSLSLARSIVMSPLTRNRAPESANLPGTYIPGPLNVEYYRQRASPGGLLITEGTPISLIVCHKEMLVVCTAADVESSYLGLRISRRSRHLDLRAGHRMEGRYRCRSRQGRLHLLPTLARWPRHRFVTHWWCSARLRYNNPSAGRRTIFRRGILIIRTSHPLA